MQFSKYIYIYIFQNIRSGLPKGGKWKEKFKNSSKNDRNTLSKIEDTRTLKASPVDWKDQEHPSMDWKSLRELPRELRPSAKSPVSYKMHNFSQVSWRTPPWVQGTRTTPSRVVKKRISPESWGNSFVCRINTSSPSSLVSHEGEEENFPPMDYTLSETSS